MRRFSKSFLLINTCRNFYSTKYFHSASLKFLKRVDPKLKYISNCTQCHLRYFNFRQIVWLSMLFSPCHSMINMNLNTNLLINLYDLLKLNLKILKQLVTKLTKSCIYIIYINLPTSKYLLHQNITSPISSHA